MNLLSHHLRFVGVFLVAVSMLGCGESQSQTVDDVATVNGSAITVDQFEETYVNYLIHTGENDTPESRYLHLDNLIDAFLLEERAVELGLDEEGMFHDFIRREERSAVGGAFFDEAFLSTLPELTDAQIREAFRQSKEQRVVRQLFYRDPAVAEQAYQRLQDGSSFEQEAVICYDLAAIDSSAGLLGPIRYFQVDPSFALAAFQTPVGSYSAPVRSRFGYHIIQVDDAIRNPLISESEYQVKKGGVASQLRHQIRLREGDSFVRSYMEGLNVKVDRAGVLALSGVINELKNSVNPDAVNVLQNEVDGVDLAELLEGFSPETVLATYNFGGQDREFTAAQYLFWFEDLPFAEASNRTGASVGRALRNEVFAMAGEANNLGSNPDVRRIIADRQRLKLAEMMRDRLRAQGAEPSEEELLDAYTRSGLASQARWRATFWAAKFNTKREADSARESLLAGRTSQRDYDDRVEFVDLNMIEQPQWRNSVRSVAIDSPVVVGLKSDWYVLTVKERLRLTETQDEKLDEIREAMSPLVPEYRLLNELRQSADIRINNDRFEQIMRLQRD